MLEVLTVVEQSLESWETHQRHTRHLIVDTWVLEEERVTWGKGAEMSAYLLMRTGQKCQDA